MSEELDRTEQFVRHLSGELAKNDLDHLEQKILEDDDLFESCMAVEAEMVDAWIRGELPRSQASGLAELLGASSRLQTSFQTTLALDARAPESPHSTEVTGSFDREEKGLRKHWPGLLLALLLGIVAGAAGYGMLIHAELQTTQVELESIRVSLQQVEEELRQAEETNNILEVELARDEARGRQ